MTEYLVLGPTAYREHAPGETFEASLEPGAEERALARRNIVVVNPTPTTLQPGSWRLPAGWPRQEREAAR